MVRTSQDTSSRSYGSNAESSQLICGVGSLNFLPNVISQMDSQLFSSENVHEFKDTQLKRLGVNVNCPGYSCSVCGQTFSKQVNLTRHHRVHTGEKPFACPACPYQASRKEHLEKHYLRMHHALDQRKSTLDNY